MELGSNKPDLFVPRRWLRGGHLQTFAGNFMKRPSVLPEGEERLFSVEEDVQVLCHCHWQTAAKAAAPTVLIVHGLEGSSNSQYVLGLGAKAWKLGWNVVRMNIRNCGGTEKLTRTLYHSGLSGDIRSVVSALIELDGLERVFLVGYSMGGNQVLKCMGEWADDAPEQVKGAATVSPACDLSLSADAVHSLSNRVYEWWFLIGLHQRLRRKAELFPGIYDLRLLKKSWSIRSFDEYVTARYMGFAGAEDYYARSSASRVVDHIELPTLIIHSQDDPFVVIAPDTEAKIEANEHITYLRTEHGGHCAFLAEPNGYDGRWAEKTVIEFFQSVLASTKAATEPQGAGHGR
jgi:predicted alpha/beta-fold hydrolase